MHTRIYIYYPCIIIILPTFCVSLFWLDDSSFRSWSSSSPVCSFLIRPPLRSRLAHSHLWATVVPRRSPSLTQADCARLPRAPCRCRQISGSTPRTCLFHLSRILFPVHGAYLTGPVPGPGLVVHAPALAFTVPLGHCPCLFPVHAVPSAILSAFSLLLIAPSRHPTASSAFHPPFHHTHSSSLAHIYIPFIAPVPASARRKSLIDAHSVPITSHPSIIIHPQLRQPTHISTAPTLLPYMS